MVENARRLAAACRRVGIPLIHVWFVCEPGHPSMLANAPLFKGLVASNALVRGTGGRNRCRRSPPSPATSWSRR